MTTTFLQDSRYTEEIEYFMISENGSKLVIIGADHHYIFNVDQNLKSILISDNKPQLAPEFGYFQAELDSTVSGRYTLTNKTPVDSTQEQWLKEHGFTFNKHTQHFTYKAELNGTRYRADKKINDLYSFDNTYTITVIEDDSTAEKAGKIMLTPLTLTADGVLVVAGTVILVPLVVGGYYFSAITEN